MNYEKIYDDFIADRLAKEDNLIASGEYFERHHILPRSMGGSDDADNLVALTAGDHYFAHLCLAKAHGFWKAVVIMSGNNKGTARKVDKKWAVRNRKWFSIAAKKAGKEQADIMRKKWSNPDFKKARKKAIKKAQNTPEYKAYCSARNEKRYADPKERKKASSAAKKSLARHDVKQKISVAAKRVWSEQREKIVEAQKKGWQNEERKERHKKAMLAVGTHTSAKNKARSKAIRKTYLENPDRWNGTAEAARKRHAANRKPVINLDTGDTFETVIDALSWQQENGKKPLKGYGDINAVCRGRGKTAGGYRWAYA